MNVFAKFYEIPSLILQDIKETKLYGHTHGRTDNMKTVYPPTNTVCGGYNYCVFIVAGRSRTETGDHGEHYEERVGAYSETGKYCM